MHLNHIWCTKKWKLHLVYKDMENIHNINTQILLKLKWDFYKTVFISSHHLPSI